MVFGIGSKKRKKKELKDVALSGIKGPAENDFHFIKGQMLLGREKGDIQITDPMLSSSHAEFSFAGGVLTVTDKESSNGVLLNGEKIEAGKSVILQVDDELQVGNSVFKVVFFYKDQSELTQKKKVDAQDLNEELEDAGLDKAKKRNKKSKKEQSKKAKRVGPQPKAADQNPSFLFRVGALFSDLLIVVFLSVFTWQWTVELASAGEPMTGFKGFFNPDIRDLSFIAEIFILLFFLVRVVWSLIFGASLSTWLLGARLSGEWGENRSRFMIFTHSLVSFIVSVPLLGIPSLVFALLRKGSDFPSYFTTLYLRKTTNQSKLLPSIKLFAFSILLIACVSAPYIKIYTGLESRVVPSERSLSSGSERRIPVGYTYLPLYDMMVALPFESEKWQLIPELTYVPRSEIQFLEKVAFYISRKGEGSLNKITFLGRRSPEFESFPLWAQTQGLSKNDPPKTTLKEIKESIFWTPNWKDPKTYLDTESKIPFFSFFSKASLKREIFHKDRSERHVPSAVAWLRNRYTELIQVSFVPEKERNQAPLAIQDKNRYVAPNPEGPWIDVVHGFKDVIPFKNQNQKNRKKKAWYEKWQESLLKPRWASRGLEMRWVWTEGKAGKDQILFDEVLSSVYFPKSLKDGQKYIAQRIKRLGPNQLSREASSGLPLALLTSRLTLSPHRWEGFYHFAKMNEIFLQKQAKALSSGPLKGVVINNMLAAQKYLKDLRAPPQVQKEINQLIGAISDKKGRKTASQK
jgi:hypothetical protein